MNKIVAYISKLRRKLAAKFLISRRSRLIDKRDNLTKKLAEAKRKAAVFRNAIKFNQREPVKNANVINSLRRGAEEKNLRVRHLEVRKGRFDDSRAQKLSDAKDIARIISGKKQRA